MKLQRLWPVAVVAFYLATAFLVTSCPPTHAEVRCTGAECADPVVSVASVSTTSLTYGCPRFTWTNSTVTACGAVTTCNIAVCTLPARARVLGALVQVTGPAAGPTTVTVSVGRVAASYIDYVVASNAKVTATYGDGAAELGTGIILAGDTPSLTATTVVNMQLVSTVGNLDTVTGSSGTASVVYSVWP